MMNYVHWVSFQPHSTELDKKRDWPAGFNFFDAGGFKSAQPHCMKAEFLLLTL